MKKCSLCKKKFSVKKIEREFEIIKHFCKSHSALSAAKIMGVSYKSVTAKYERFRVLITEHLEEIYSSANVEEFDEYIYLEASKRNNKHHIFDAHNFITFSYSNRVYALLMPSLALYKQHFLDDELDRVYFSEFKRFMRTYEVAKLQKKENTITKFWDFFEKFIVKFKGVKRENFAYYLKEAEFKFNYTQNEQREILLNLWLGDK